jgi:hypothetical protein
MERALVEYREGIERFCTARQVPYFLADTEKPFEELVLELFRKGGFLR